MFLVPIPAYQHGTQHTTHSTSVCQSSWSDSTRHTAPANRLSATTSLVCWLLGMVPGCLVGTRWGSICLGSPTLASSPYLPMLFNLLLRCLFGSLLACQRACLWPRPLRGLWPRGRANRSGLWDLSAAVRRRNTQGQDRSANRMGRGSQAARLQIATPHSSTVAKGKGPDPAAPRCWVSFLQQPTPRSAHALSPPPSGPLVWSGGRNQ